MICLAFDLSDPLFVTVSWQYLWKLWKYRPIESVSIAIILAIYKNLLQKLKSKKNDLMFAKWKLSIYVILPLF